MKFKLEFLFDTVFVPSVGLTSFNLGQQQSGFSPELELKAL